MLAFVSEKGKIKSRRGEHKLQQRESVAGEI